MKTKQPKNNDVFVVRLLMEVWAKIIYFLCVWSRHGAHKVICFALIKHAGFLWSNFSTISYGFSDFRIVFVAHVLMLSCFSFPWTFSFRSQSNPPSSVISWLYERSWVRAKLLLEESEKVDDEAWKSHDSWGFSLEGGKYESTPKWFKRPRKWRDEKKKASNPVVGALP